MNKETLEEPTEKAKQRAKNYMSLKGALEPKQETLEEAALRFYPKVITDPYNPSEDLLKEERTIFIEGAKWMQEKMYSEEEVRKIAEEVRWQAIGDPLEFTKNFDKWFEQFKKK